MKNKITMLNVNGVIKWLALFVGLMVLSTLSAQAKTDIEFVDMQGNKVMLSDFKGQWVVVNIWATWCPPCIKEMPDLTFFHEQNENAIVLGVNFENIPVEKVNSFTEELMISFPIVRFSDVDLNSNRTPFGPLRGLPSTYMVAPSGEIVAGRAGLVDQDVLEGFIKAYEDKYLKN